MPSSNTAASGLKAARNIRIPMPDGVQLAANLLLPDTGGPFPAVFSFTPYHKDGTRSAAIRAAAHQHFASRGYATLDVDFRGVGCSEGTNPFPFDPQERADGHAVVEWIAVQPWCTGAVGLWGTSYGGCTSLSIASTRPQHLKAIVPIHGTFDNYDWYLRPHGCQGLMYNEVSWAPRLVATNLAPPLIQEDGDRWLEIWRERLEANMPWLLSWHGEPPDPDFWLRRRVPYERIAVPTFLISGWYDKYAGPSFMVYEALHGPKRILIGPWKHAFPDFSPVHPIGALREMDRWWDRWLKGLENGVDREPPVTVYVLGAGYWRYEADWPLARAERVAFRVGPDGRLSRGEDEQRAGSDTWVYDSRVGIESVALHGGIAGIPLPSDQSADDHRSLSYTTPPLASDLELGGTPVAHVVLSATTPAPSLAVKLCEVDPRGDSIVIAREWTNVSQQSAHDPRRPLARDEVRQISLALSPVCRVVPAGHRLRLCLAGADFPEIWPTPEPYELQIHYGGARASLVEVPVISDRGAGLPAPSLPAADADGFLRLSAGVRSDETHVVHRDLIGKTVSYEATFHYEQGFDAHTNTGLDYHGIVTTNADRPWTTNLRAEVLVQHRRSAGSVSIRVNLLATPFVIHVDVEADLDGRQVFQRRWRKDLPVHTTSVDPRESSV